MCELLRDRCACGLLFYRAGLVTGPGEARQPARHQGSFWRRAHAASLSRCSRRSLRHVYSKLPMVLSKALNMPISAPISVGVKSGQVGVHQTLQYFNHHRVSPSSCGDTCTGKPTPTLRYINVMRESIGKLYHSSKEKLYFNV
jgi:hypothetical protein